MQEGRDIPAFFRFSEAFFPFTMQSRKNRKRESIPGRAAVFLPGLMAALLSHCTSAATVERESLQYLADRYNEPFRVLSLDMQRNEGNWGMAILEVAPSNQPEIKFRLNYRYSRDRVTYEDYLVSSWEYRLLEKLRGEYAILLDSASSVSIGIGKRKSLALNSMNLQATKDLEGLKAISEPTVHIKLSGLTLAKQQVFREVSRLISHLRAYGFEKVAIEALLGEEGKLLVQSYGAYGSPSEAELADLFHTPGEPFLSEKTEARYREALGWKEQGRTSQAIQGFRSIVQEFDSPFRYNPYVEAQSGYVYESMYELFLIYMEQGKKQQARLYLDMLEDRLSYEEAPLKFLSMLREGKARLESP